jgi:hypothetical protein
MNRRNRPLLPLLPLLGLFLALFTSTPGRAAVSDIRPPADDPADHAFPALGMVADRKVEVAWNRFYDTQGLASILARLHAAFPDRTKLYSIGKSVGGRDLWCLEITAPGTTNALRKPAFYIDGNIHGNEVQAGEVVAYTAWYLCHQYGRLPKVTEILDRCVFYLIPTINPDGRDHWFASAHSAHSSRTGIRPNDDDHDGATDEDGYDDLDGDGSITQMRVRDPAGRWKPHPRHPRFLMVPAAPDEHGEFTLLGQEGLDNDDDGQVNEDPPGGYDMNRNWGYDWQPRYVQGGAHDYPFSLPETRAIAEFVAARPHIAGAQSYHNAGGMILRPPGREGGASQHQDDRIAREIAARGEKMLPFYRSMIIWKDLYTTWGGELDWFYGARGILGFTTELWTPRNLDRGGDPSSEDQLDFAKHVLLGDGAVAWKTYQHPLYGLIEIGGMKKNWGRVPPSFLLEEECHRNMAFTLFHAEHLPLITLQAPVREPLPGGLSRITVTLRNDRLLPTRLDQDTLNHITRPDILSLTGNGLKVHTSGEVTDRYRNRIEAARRQPERVELQTIPGMAEVRVQFVVSGSGTALITFDSVKGGLRSATLTVP